MPILIVVHLWEVGVVNKTIDLLFGVLYGSRKKIYDWNQKQEHKTLKDNDRHLFKRAMTWMLLEPCKHLFARFSQRTLSFAINQIYLFFIRMGLIRQSAINFGAVFYRHAWWNTLQVQFLRESFAEAWNSVDLGSFWNVPRISGGNAWWVQVCGEIAIGNAWVEMPFIGAGTDFSNLFAIDASDELSANAY